MTIYEGVKRSTVYALIDPREPDAYRYVGKTTYANPQARLSQHLRKARVNCTTHRDSWIRSLLDVDVKPEMVILETGDWISPELAAVEVRWIEQLLASGSRLTNHTPGGEGGNTTGRPAQGRKPYVKLSPEEAFARRSAAQKGRPKSPEQRAKIRSTLLNKEYTEEQRAAFTSNVRRGFTQTPEHIAKRNETRRRNAEAKGEKW